MQRMKLSAALVFAGALLLSGCAAGGGDADTTAGGCDTVQSDVRDISNGAQNALATGGDPSEVTSALEGYSERAAALGEDAADDVSGAVDSLVETLDEAAQFAETLPTDPEAEVDADAVAEHQTAIQEAAAEVSSACTADAKG